MKQFLAAVLVAVLVLPSPVLAHGGRTDASGGHTDRSTGEYHYHHGYSAHQHPNGVCPYNFDDQTNHSSGTASGNSSSSGSSSWVYVDSRFFEGFRYNETTDEWLSDDGEYYESSGELFDCYGFYYDYGCDVWYNEDGFIDEDFCVRDHSDGGFFYCNSCENLMFSSESDDPDCHTGDCLDLDEYEQYEEYDDFEAEGDSYYAYDSYDSYDSPSYVSPTPDPEEDPDSEENEKTSFIRALGFIIMLFPVWLPVGLGAIGTVAGIAEKFRSRKNK